MLNGKSKYDISVRILIIYLRSWLAMESSFNDGDIESLNEKMSKNNRQESRLGMSAT